MVSVFHESVASTSQGSGMLISLGLQCVCVVPSAHHFCALTGGICAEMLLDCIIADSRHTVRHTIRQLTAEISLAATFHWRSKMLEHPSNNRAYASQHTCQLNVLMIVTCTHSI